MAKRGLAYALVFIFLFAMPLKAAKAVTVSVLEPAAWSEWQTDEIIPNESLEVERGDQTLTRQETVYAYSRYVYYNLEANKWYCAPAEQEGAHVQPETGYWENRESESPLLILSAEGDTLYEGGWYNEKATAKSVPYTALMYRSRALKRVTCEISAREMLIFPGKTRQLTANLYDDAGYTWTSSDERVASVDSAGNVTGHEVGAAMVYARSVSGREVACEVLVCQKNAEIPDGVYTLRLSKTNKTLTVGRNLATERKRVLVADYRGERDQRFMLSNIGSGRTFVFSAIENRKYCLDVARKNAALEAGNDVQVHKKKDRTAQYWRAVYVPDGSYILYPKANARLVLGAEPLEAGNNVRLEAQTALETLDRWVLIRTGESATPSDSFQRPVIRDGQSFVSADFGENGEGALILKSNGRRVFVLSSARGKVVTVHDRCTHDEPKQPDAKGVLYDPCGALGNYVVIDHGGGNLITYAHLSEIYVREGAEVWQNSMIGRSGATGAVSEVCLSLGLQENGEAKDPRAIIQLPDKNKPID